VNPFSRRSDDPSSSLGKLKCVWIAGADGRLECIWVPDWERDWERDNQAVARPAGSAAA